ncbi:MAG TPA: SurA N-terminal domain-containing protein [Acidobacteriaceae bacterium]|nr:SurA N-terminal domain-containing protein [Acidobacteriaceae bacterium]
MENGLNVIMQTLSNSTTAEFSRGPVKMALQRTAKLGAVAIAGALFFASLAGCSRTPNPDVWATVNGHPITESEVNKYYETQVNSRQQQPTADEAAMLKLEVLHQQIGEEVIRQQAEKLHLVATDAEVDAKIAQLKAPYTEQQFNDQLKTKGLTMDDIRRDIWLNLTMDKVMNKEIESKINITDEDVANFYNLHQAEFNLIEPRYHLAQIVVTPTPAQQVGNLQNSKARNDQEARKKINLLHNQLETGANFAQLAANYSEDPNTNSSGGDMGFIPASQLKSDPEVFAAISKLQPSQITPVLPITRGPSKQPAAYIIFKLIAIEPAGQHPLSDPRVQQMIRQQLHDSRSRLLESAYNEMLRDQARVVNYYAEDILKNAH